MKNTRYLIVLIALALTLASSSAVNAVDASSKSPNAAVPATPAVPAIPGSTDSPTTPATPAIPAVPSKPDSGKPDASEKPGLDPSQSGGPSDQSKPPISDEVKKAVQEARKERADYQAKKAELLRSLKGSNAQEREDIRAKLRDNRELFLAQQRENRVELRKNIEALKNELTEHKEVLEEVRDKTKTRKGGDE